MIQPSLVLGKHAIIDLSGCDPQIITNHQLIHEILLQAADIAEVTIVGCLEHSFQPQGYSATLVLEESHLSIHTWPEYDYISLDLYSCNLQTNFDAVAEFLARKFGATITEYHLLERGCTGKTN